jgi:hypothetical protein
MSSQIIINGKVYEGNNVIVRNNRVFIDGKDTTPDAKTIDISVLGNISELRVDAANQVHVKGDVGSASLGSADIICNNIANGVTTGSGDVECESITGNVRTGSGDVKAKTITGSVNTGSGDIITR